MGKDGEPFSDMSIFDGDGDPVESGEKFTVEEWQELTQGWHQVNAFLAKTAASMPSERRIDLAQTLNLKTLFGEFGESADWSSLVANIFSLSDEALRRLNTALAINEMQGKLQKPGKPGQGN